MNKRKKVADAKHRARARKLEEKRKALKASGGVPPARPMTPRPAPRPQAAAPRPAAPQSGPPAPAPRPTPPAAAPAPAPSDTGEGQPG